MRRSKRTLIGCAAIALALPASSIGCGRGTASGSSDSSTTSPAGAPVNAGQVVSTVKVGQGFAFDPKAVTVKAGATVTFKNDSASNHTVKSDDGQAVNFSSGSMAPTTTFVFTPDKPGTYSYFCSIHGKDVMSGTITVTA